jgi:hypothetical protein
MPNAGRARAPKYFVHKWTDRENIRVISCEQGGGWGGGGGAADEFDVNVWNGFGNRRRLFTPESERVLLREQLDSGRVGGGGNQMSRPWLNQNREVSVASANATCRPCSIGSDVGIEHLLVVKTCKLGKDFEGGPFAILFSRQRYFGCCYVMQCAPPWTLGLPSGESHAISVQENECIKA